MASQKEMNEKLIGTLKEWQKVEDDSVKSTSDIISKTKNPVIRQVMEIIRQDSAMHRKVQQLIIDNFEKETIRLAEESKKNSRNFIVRYLLGYLLTDEQKHNDILAQMEDIKSGIYPYA